MTGIPATALVMALVIAVALVAVVLDSVLHGGDDE